MTEGKSISIADEEVRLKESVIKMTPLQQRSQDSHSQYDPQVSCSSTAPLCCWYCHHLVEYSCISVGGNIIGILVSLK